ncbi:MAG: beta-ketoacyl-ACP synthase II [Christensenellales bacterium]|jgi:3-oxoacyl-[acyl-carrier-protein] synthase II
MKRVVITGMGVISPVGNDTDTYWKNLTNGYCGIGPITRFDTKDFKATLAAQVKDFSPEAYGIEGRTARRMDAFTQYAVAAARQAMDQSRLSGAVAPDRLGVYVGSGVGGIETLTIEAEKLLTRGPGRVSPLFVPMMIANIAAGYIAMDYNAQGPSLPVVTACATSTNAIGEAFRAIRYGYADAIIAGGSEAAVTPLAIAGFINSQALSTSDDPACASLPFDKRRAGFVMGEGAAILILEEYEHAKQRGAGIFAEICGYGNTCDAYHVTAPRPDATCAARAIALSAQEAGIGDGDVIYINAHGTGTPMNDPAETAAIKIALGEEQARRVLVSSTKSMTGHMLGAAGAAEAVAGVLSIMHKTVPPTINYREPDPECDLDYVPNQARAAEISLVLSISLGFGGHNGCIALRPAQGQ